MHLDSLSFDDRRPCDPRHGRRCRSWWTAAALTALGLLASGCYTKQHCEPLQRCGGDLLAGAKDSLGIKETEWVAEGPDACMDQVQLPIVPVSLSQQPARSNGKKAPGNATVDWCSSLSQKPDGSLRYQPFFPIIPLKNAHLKLKEDHTFDAHFTAAAPQHMAFSASCRSAQGITVSCPELGRRIKEAIAAEANVYNTRCYDDNEGGCMCDYDLSLFTSLPGSWSTDNDQGIVTFFDQSLAPFPPAPTDYCVQGDTLSMTGHNGQQLFNRPDLRTLVFHPPSCFDGLQTGDETGVDCGGSCGNACGTCTDGVQNQDETGVDCGGIVCHDFCACFNGVQDPWEDGVDCGGPCSLLCSCTNGKQDGSEEGVDCGGECQTRYESSGPIECKK
jgi:hypothetical protein